MVSPIAGNFEVPLGNALEAEAHASYERQACVVVGHDGRLDAMEAKGAECSIERQAHGFAGESLLFVSDVNVIADVGILKDSANS